MMKSRTDILKQNQILAESVIRNQIIKKQFDADIVVEQEYIDLQSFTNVVSKAVKRSEALKKKKLRFWAGDDEYPFDCPLNPTLLGTGNYQSNQKDDEVKEMDTLLVLSDMQSLLGARHLVVLSGSLEPWLGYWDDDEDMQAAISFVKKQGVDINFEGGFELSGNDIITYLPHLKTLSPNLAMAFEDSKTVISICSEGNIHLEFYDESEQELLVPFLASKGFTKVEKCGPAIDSNAFYQMLGMIIDNEFNDDIGDGE